jgi:hypothetical protein
MQSEQRSRGVVYLAFGDRYHAEARQSLRSLRRVSKLPVAVVTDRPWSEEPQPDRFVIVERVEGFASKPRYVSATPFEDTLFIDTDTVIAIDPEPLFGMLELYDIGVHFGGPQLNEAPYLELHTQCSSGVILFRRNERVDDVFRRWNEEFDRARAIHTADDPRGLGDQRYLAIAIARSTARPVHLAAYCNFVVFDTTTTLSPPLIYHGRIPHMEQLHDEIGVPWDTARDWHPRLWLPNIRGVLPAGIRRSDPLLALSLVLRRIFNDVRRWWRALRKRK